MSTTPPYEPAAPGAPAPSPSPYGSPAPSADTRPRSLAITALVLAIAGTLISFVGFIPMAWVGLIAVLVGGLALLIAFILSIVSLVSRRQGGTGLGITALIVSVVGGVIGGIAMFVSLVFIGLATSESTVSEGPSPAVTQEATDEPTDSTDDGDAAAADEAAFLDDVRPQLVEIMTQLDPSVTAEQVESTFPDETLITIGQALLVTGEAGIEPMVEQAAAAIGDDSASATLRDLYSAILTSAQTHLQ